MRLLSWVPAPSAAWWGDGSRSTGMRSCSSRGARTTRRFATMASGSSRPTPSRRFRFLSSTRPRASPGRATTSSFSRPKPRIRRAPSINSRQTAPRTLPILCAQNGVANERMAADRFANVYGVFVWCPADYLTPGTVQVWCAPTSGILHVGCYPSGTNPTAEAATAAFRESTFLADAKPDIMRWKYRKLLSNLGNAVDALCGTAARGSGLAQRARREGIACLEAAGISFIADDEEDAGTARAPGAAENDRRRGAAGRIVMAESRPPAGNDRDGLSERRNRPDGTGPRSADARQRVAAVPVATGRARAAPAWQHQPRQDSDCARSSTESTGVAPAGRRPLDRSASQAA